MAVALSSPLPTTASTRQARCGARPLASVRFDWLFALTSAWFTGGLYLDGWAHNTIPSLETFFTPWHGVLYSGFLAAFASLGWAIGRNRAAGYGWWKAIPAGYELSLIGGLLFAASGVADMLWHIVFGIEANIDALLSPTHLSLLLGGTLMVTGPVRAAGRRIAAGFQPADWSALLPRVLGLTFVLLSLAFFTQYANLWSGPWLASSYRPLTPNVLTSARPLEADQLLQSVNVAAVLVQSALLAGIVLVAVRGARVPIGGFSVMIGLYTVMTVLMRQKYDNAFEPWLLLAGVLAGVATDAVYAGLRPSLTRPFALRTFAALVPALSTTAVIASLAAAQGVWWSIHLWAGVVVLSAGVGFLLSLLAAPAESASDPDYVVDSARSINSASA